MLHPDGTCGDDRMRRSNKNVGTRADVLGMPCIRATLWSLFKRALAAAILVVRVQGWQPVVPSPLECIVVAPGDGAQKLVTACMCRDLICTVLWFLRHWLVLPAWFAEGVS